MLVGNARRLQTFRQVLSIELRIAAGAGNRAHIDQLPDAGGLNDANEFVDWMRRMPDSPDRQPSMTFAFQTSN